jgi:hypothetical protein
MTFTFLRLHGRTQREKKKKREIALECVGGSRGTAHLTSSTKP